MGSNPNGRAIFGIRYAKIYASEILAAFRNTSNFGLNAWNKFSDEEAARRTGRKVSAVTNRRQRKGRPPVQFLRRPWTRAEDKLLGTDTDEAVGQLLARDKSTVGDRRKLLGLPSKVRDWTSTELKLLGKIPDRQLAQQLGRTLFSIQNKRLKLGIPAASNPKYRPWSDEELRRLGTMPDSDLGEVGWPYEAVRDKRNQLKIPYELRMVEAIRAGVASGPFGRRGCEQDRSYNWRGATEEDKTDGWMSLIISIVW